MEQIKYPFDYTLPLLPVLTLLAAYIQLGGL